METNSAIGALGSLAHDTRLLIFRLLVRVGPDGLPAGEIATALNVPNATLSFHLNHLSQGGLVKGRRAGRSIIYSIDVEAVRKLFAYLMEDCCQGLHEFQADSGRICGIDAKSSAACCAPKPKASRRRNKQ